MKDKLRKIMGDIFNVSPDMIKDDSSPADIENWDSLNHMNLMVAVEEEFGVSFSEEEMIDLMSFDLLLKKIAEKSA